MKVILHRVISVASDMGYTQKMEIRFIVSTIPDEE